MFSRFWDVIIVRIVYIFYVEESPIETNYHDEKKRTNQTRVHNIG